MRTFAAGALLWLASSLAWGQSGANVLKLVVPYPPGGPVDALARAVAPALSAGLKQPVVVENRTGANEIIAADYVAKSKPDGQTLLVTTDAAVTMNPHLYKKLPYDPRRDLDPVSQWVSVPMVLLATKSLEVGTARELVARAKKQPNGLSYASSGPGGITHVPLSVFERTNDISLIHVPYKGAGALMPDLLSGNVQVSLLAVSVAEQHVRAGSLRALAVSARKRIAAMPEVPTFVEQGLKDIGGAFFIGLMAPSGTPLEFRQKVSDIVRGTLTDVDFRGKYLDPYAYDVVGSTPQSFKDFLEVQLQSQAGRIKQSGASLD